MVGTYNARPHSEIGEAPREAWAANAFLPRLPESLEELDLLLIQHAKPRVVQRDGIRFEGLRYMSPTLAAFVREPVTVASTRATSPRSGSSIATARLVPRSERGARR